MENFTIEKLYPQCFLAEEARIFRQKNFKPKITSQKFQAKHFDSAMIEYLDY